MDRVSISDDGFGRRYFWECQGRASTSFMRLRPAWIEGIAEFRARDHTISGLISGRSPPYPGEVMLAHLGVLFLEESSEFQQTLSVPV